MPDTYHKPWSRQYRGLLVFLLDQSGSMQEEVRVGGKVYTNGQMATATLNNLIFSIIQNTPPDNEMGGLRDYCDILVLGYGDQVTTLLHNGRNKPVSIRELATRKPIGYANVLVERYDSREGKVVQSVEKQPCWIEYTASSRYTQMAQVLNSACKAVNDWLLADSSHPLSFPPIVINITDGQHNGSGDPVLDAENIRRLTTNDGHVLLFNCHLTSHVQEAIAFPKAGEIINVRITDIKEREWANKLFQMSSAIPQPMTKKARESFHVKVEDGARGFLYNANPSELINFLQWGTLRGEIPWRSA